MGLYSNARALAFSVAKRIVKFLYHDIKVLRALCCRPFPSRPSIKSVHEGARAHPGGIYAIFLLWQPKRFSWYVQNALESLNEAGINIVAVINHDLSEDQLAYLSGHTRSIIIRDNSGFDIGGYKDATTYLAKSNIALSRLLYLNDSTYFFKGGLTDLFRRMITSEADIIGTFENWEFTYHIQSFCFAVSGDLFRSEKFQRFWTSYLPVNSRLWAIQAGEIGLSRAMIPIASSIDIIYKPNALRPALSTLSKDDYTGLIKLYPGAIRFPHTHFLRLPKSACVDELVSRIGLRSQIHTGGFLYRKYLACPIVKRDLLYRRQFSADEIEQALLETGHEGHLDEIMTDFKRRGDSLHLSVLSRLKVANGIL
ncbi:rhamnan synthesis F family protein [Mesorhizobium sp. J8]|uniref:rhamnan synthesis F family protein n=1 Tax=Mesorhizobium sp. J8 TaxID=2777475 RepID=UPI0019157A35|nr:rhamnan synthesis F family protein [Mesorhizobium sp. J8]BCM18237.1 hypothetical protein MJ8_20050 [Mesorhizobium sp. J8]